MPEIVKTRHAMDSLSFAMEYRKKYGGHIAVEDGENPRIYWYSMNHTPSEIFLDLPNTEWTLNPLECGIPAMIDTPENVDEGRVIATRIVDEWVLFESDFDGKKYWASPDIVEYESGASDRP